MPSPSNIVSKQNVSDPDHKKYFFDEVQVESFLRQLTHDRFVLITAEKGAGVSTFMRYIASTIQDKVRSEASDKMPEHWTTINVRPGLSPLKSLLRELSRIDFSDAKKTINFEADAENILNSSNSMGLINLFNTYPIREHEKLLIILDPLDDLFLFENTYQGEEINRFVNLLYTFPQHSSLPVYFVITFANKNAGRSNHYAKLLDLLYKYKFNFSGPSIEDIPEMVKRFFQNLPTELQQVQDLIAEQLRLDLQKYKTEHSWKYLLQLILKQFYAEYQKPLLDRKERPKTREAAEAFWKSFYKSIGGVDNLINVQAEHIRTNLTEDDQLLCLLMFRTLINKQGDFEPIQLKTMFEILEGVIFFSKEYQTRLETLIKTFTVDLEILELIHPMEISDRGISLGKEFKVSPGTVIMLRNNFFKSQWSFFNTCIEEKVKLVLDYEWYCRMSQKKEEMQYPSSLQPYAMAERNNPESLNNPEFSYINIIKELTPAWIIRNIGSAKSDIEDLDRTKRFIKEGVAYWKKVADDEERERKRIAKKRERFILFGFAIVLLTGIFYLTVTGLQNHMQEDYDLVMQKNMVIRSNVDSIFANYIKLSNSANQIDSVKTETFISVKGMLHYNPGSFQVEEVFFLTFIVEYNKNREIQKKSIIELQQKSQLAISRSVDEFGAPNDSNQMDPQKKDSIINLLNANIKRRVLLEDPTISEKDYDHLHNEFSQY